MTSKMHHSVAIRILTVCWDGTIPLESIYVLDKIRSEEISVERETK